MPEPSLRYVVVSLHGETRTMCFRGRNWRVESRGRAHIENRDLRRSFDLDLESRVYTARPLNVRVRGGKRLPPSGRLLYVYTETADTGERREMFGYTARRVLIRTTLRLSTETGPCQSTESDGWYIGPPAAWPPSHGHAILLAGAPDGGIDTPVFTHAGPRETGLPLLVTRTLRSPVHTSTDREEVTEFSEKPLDPALFLPPPGFRRQPWPFTVRLRLEWEKLKASFLTRS